jgi:hypothetical protein
MCLAKIKNILFDSHYSSRKRIYKLAAADAKLQPILTKDGAYETSLSPDESRLLIRYSYKNKPWKLFLADNKQILF